MKLSSAITSIIELFRKQDVPLISPREVHARLGSPNFFVFDSTLLSQWRRGHIPGSVYVGMDDYAPELLPKSKDATLVFYCYKKICTASHMSAKRARELGYRKVFVMQEGTKGWVALKYGLVTEHGGITAPQDGLQET